MGAEEVGREAELIGAEEKTIGKTGAELATAIRRASGEARREMWGTIIGGAWIEKPAKMMVRVDIGQVAATVAAGRTEGDEWAPLKRKVVPLEQSLQNKKAKRVEEPMAICYQPGRLEETKEAESNLRGNAR